MGNQGEIRYSCRDHSVHLSKPLVAVRVACRAYTWQSKFSREGEPVQIPGTLRFLLFLFKTLMEVKERERGAHERRTGRKISVKRDSL
jgi:hypothetical protein